MTRSYLPEKLSFFSGGNLWLNFYFAFRYIFTVKNYLRIKRVIYETIFYYILNCDTLVLLLHLLVALNISYCLLSAAELCDRIIKITECLHMKGDLDSIKLWMLRRGDNVPIHLPSQYRLLTALPPVDTRFRFNVYKTSIWCRRCPIEVL